MKISELMEILQLYKDEEGDVKVHLKIDDEKHPEFIVYPIYTCKNQKEETFIEISQGLEGY